MNTYEGDIMHPRHPYIVSEPNTYSNQARDIAGAHLWRIDRPELTPTMYTTGTWSYLARLGLDMRAARPLMFSE